VRVLKRRFRVRVSIERAWARLEKVEEWPSWARHIRRITLNPPGQLTAKSEGVIHLTNGVRSTFRMEELNPQRNWKWAGPFLWLTVHYDHRFERVDRNESEVTFTIDVEGFGAAVFGGLFAAIYSINLKRAIPLLVKEIEQQGLRD
jgi:hypothetical protein